MSGTRTLYQDTGQMEALDEDTSHTLHDWTEKRYHWLSTFEWSVLESARKLILDVGRRVQEGDHD